MQKTLVATVKFIAIANKLGLDVEAQKGWIKLRANGDDSRRMYVANGKASGDVHLSGFIHPLGTEIPADKRPTAKVVQRISFAQGEVDILRAFYRIAKEGLVERRGQDVVTVRAARKSMPEPSVEEIEAAVAAACGEEAIDPAI